MTCLKYAECPALGRYELRVKLRTNGLVWLETEDKVRLRGLDSYQQVVQPALEAAIEGGFGFFS